MEDITPDNPYYLPSQIYYRPELLESVHSCMSGVAAQLVAGQVESLPDGVLALLRDHTEAVNHTGVGEARLWVAGQASQPPFDTEKAQTVGQALLGSVEATNAAQIDFDAADAKQAAIWKKHNLEN